MSIHMKKGDVAAVEEVLGWDCRGSSEEYEMCDKAQEAFIRIKKEIRELRSRLKEETAATNRYIERLHALEGKNEK